MIVAEFSVVPSGVGTELSGHVKAALKAVEGCGVRVTPGAMGTVLEAKDLDRLFDAVKLAHEAVFTAGAERVLTSIKIDDRRDVEGSAAAKLKAVK